MTTPNDLSPARVAALIEEANEWFPMPGAPGFATVQDMIAALSALSSARDEAVQQRDTQPTTVYLLYEGFFNGREKKERLERIALTNEDARAWVHADFDWRYSRTSIPIKVFQRPADSDTTPASSREEAGTKEHAVAPSASAAQKDSTDLALQAQVERLSTEPT